MSAQVQKLEALLARVQRNAEQPRPPRALPRVPVHEMPLDPGQGSLAVETLPHVVEAPAAHDLPRADMAVDVSPMPFAAELVPVAEPVTAADEVAPVDLDALEVDLAAGEAPVEAVVEAAPSVAPEGPPITAADPADLAGNLAGDLVVADLEAPAPAVAEASISAEVEASATAPTEADVAADEDVLELEELGPADEVDEVTAISVAVPARLDADAAAADAAAAAADAEASPPTRRPADEEEEAPPSSGRQLVAAPHESARMAVAAPLTEAADAQITLEPVVQAAEPEPEPVELDLAEEHEAPPESSKSLRAGAEVAEVAAAEVAAAEVAEIAEVEVAGAEPLAAVEVEAPAAVVAADVAPAPVPLAVDEAPFVEGQIPEPPPTPLEGAVLPRYEAPPQTPKRVAPPVAVAPPLEATPVAETEARGADSSPPPETLAPHPAAVVEKVVTAVSLIGAPQGRFEPVAVTVEAAVVRADVTPTEVVSFVGAVRGPRATTFGDVLDAALDL